MSALRAQTCAIDKRILDACERGDCQAAIDLTLEYIGDTERLGRSLISHGSCCRIKYSRPSARDTSAHVTKSACSGFSLI